MTIRMELENERFYFNRDDKTRATRESLDSESMSHGVEHPAPA